jgi:hypothetical protein
MIREVYHVPGVSVKYLATRPRAEKKKNRQGCGERLRQPVRNPYERGTAGPIVWGVLGCRFFSYFSPARFVFFNDMVSPTRLARRMARVEHVALAKARLGRVVSAILVLGARLCYNGGVWRLRVRNPEPPRHDATQESEPWTHKRSRTRRKRKLPK